MTRPLPPLAWLMFALAGACGVVSARTRPETTAGVIAIANLDHQLGQAAEPEARIGLLLARSQFLGDADALDEAVSLAESLPSNGGNLLLRARARSAAHRFDEALADLDAARQAGADAGQVARQRATILVATGYVADALPQLQEAVDSRPGYASHGALATALAELGRYREADREYQAALDALDTTSPFPYAWIHFARGLMWSEQAGEKQRGEVAYDQALRYFPEFGVANTHKAEMELARNELESAAARLELPGEDLAEPEALALLAQIRGRAGMQAVAKYDIERARERYEALLQRQPLAFADHAAEFYLGPGADPERAWHWARRNLDNRAVPRAFALALRAALASGRDTCGLQVEMRAAFDKAHLAAAARAEWERRAGSGLSCWPMRCRGPVDCPDPGPAGRGRG